MVHRRFSRARARRGQVLVSRQGKQAAERRLLSPGAGLSGKLCRTAMISVAAATLHVLPAHGSETGATNFPIGVSTAFSAIYPHAGGTEVYNYNQVYTSDKYQATLGNPAPPSFHTTVIVEAVRVSHTWIDLAPNISLGSGLALNGVHQSLELGPLRGSNGFQFINPDVIPYQVNFHPLPNVWVSHIFAN